MSKTILVDVDVTICESDKWWYQWLLSRYPLKSSVLGEDQLPYNLSTLFDIPEGETGLEFWEDPKLYDAAIPRKDARRYLNKLNEAGHKIVFVSHVSKGNHTASKVRFLEGWFPYLRGCVFTHEKYLIQGDVFVDDSHSQCIKVAENNKRIQVIKYRDDYKESCVLRPSDRIFYRYGWEDIYNTIMESK